MTDEVKRISKLVAEGKLSPEDAAELIDAFYASDRSEDGDEPKAADAKAGANPNPKDALKTILDAVEKLGKEGVDSVNWPELSSSVRSSAKRGLDVLKHGLEDLGKGKVNLGWLNTQETRDVSLPLAIPAGKSLRVENAVGDVTIIGGHDVGSATAHAQFRGANREEAKAKADGYTPIIEESDHLILIRQPDVSGLRVDLEIKMPGTGNVEVRAESGDVEVKGTKGALRITGRAGDVTVEGLNGIVEIVGESGDISVSDVTTPSLTVENKGGDLTIRKVRGNVNVRTATGDVEATDVAGKTVAIESVSGDVRLDIVEPVTGSVNVRTVNGDADVAIPDGSDARVGLSTLRGDISCSVELEDQHKLNQRITGKLGAGSGSIDISAVTGDLCFRLRDASDD